MSTTRRTAKRRVATSRPDKENYDDYVELESKMTTTPSIAMSETAGSSPRRVAKRRNVNGSSPVDRKMAIPFHDVTQAMANMKFEPSSSSSLKVKAKAYEDDEETFKVEPAEDEKAPLANKKKGKAKKRVGFVSSQPTEVLTYEKDEAPEINLASILSRSSFRTAALVPVSPASQRRSGPAAARDDVIEEELAWDEDDGEAMSCFSLHELQVEVKVTRDTEQMSISELRRELSERGKSTAGTKADLVRRLNMTLLRAKDVECVEDEDD